MSAEVWKNMIQLLTKTMTETVAHAGFNFCYHMWIELHSVQVYGEMLSALES